MARTINVKISDDAHRQLKLLGANGGLTQGKVIELALAMLVAQEPNLEKPPGVVAAEELAQEISREVNGLHTTDGSTWTVVDIQELSAGSDGHGVQGDPETALPSGSGDVPAYETLADPADLKTDPAPAPDDAWMQELLDQVP